MTQLTVCIVGIMFLGSCQLGISDCGTSDKTRFYEVSGDVYSMIDRLVSVTYRNQIANCYCSGYLLQQDYGKVLDNSNGTENATFVNQVMMVLDQIELSKTCKFYTEVMTYKHKLSHYVFNNATLTSNYTTKLTLLMINLQTAAVKLQNIKVQPLICLSDASSNSFNYVDGNFSSGLHRIYCCRV